MGHSVHDGGGQLVVDVGGIFIDLALVERHTGVVVTENQPSRPETLVEEFIAELDRLTVPVAELDLIVHGTTHGLNTLKRLLSGVPRDTRRPP